MKYEKQFFHAVKHQYEIQVQFFDYLSPQLDRLRPGFFFLTGIYEEDVVELVITPDGYIKNIVFVEELIAEAPKLNHWRFTALKPPILAEDMGINMYGFEFNAETLSFYENNNPAYPDEIDITVIHKDYTEEFKSEIFTGVHIFLDNYIGELFSITAIDNLLVKGQPEESQELIPITKLKEYIKWRQKEFVEKYEGTIRNIEEAHHNIYEYKKENGNMVVAVMNVDLLKWDKKASHPWLSSVEIKYDVAHRNGMPNEEMIDQLEDIESEIEEELKNIDGHLNVGRETGDNTRVIYFASKDFRKPSKVIDAIQKKYEGTIEIDFDLYKDKYWQTLNRFMP